jgi:hypothetical protein
MKLGSLHVGAIVTVDDVENTKVGLVTVSVTC